MYFRKRILAAAFLFGCSLLQAQAVNPQSAGGSAQDHALRANTALKAGHPEQAIPEFQALVELDPGNVDAQANLGVLLYFQKQFTPASEHLRAAVERQPSLSKIRGLLGLSEMQLGHTDAAATELARALPDLQDAAFRKQVGLSLIQLDAAAQRLSDASSVAQSLREKDPADPEILYACYRTATDLAGESLLVLSLAAPASGQMQQAIAHELLRVRDISGAVASFRRAIAANPNLPGIHFELAEALRASPSTADRAEAEGQYRLDIQQNPQDVQAKIRLADLLSDRAEWKEAAALYETALQANPKNADAAVGLARVQSENGADDKAVTLLEQAIADDPSNMLAHFRLSSVYRKLHRSDEARRELTTYQKLKDVKEKLRQVYSTMKLQTPGSGDTGTAASEMTH